MNYMDITNRYFSEWVDSPLGSSGDKIVYVSSPKRDTKQPYYPEPFRVYVLKSETDFVVSYSPALSAQVDLLKRKLEPSCSPLKIIEILRGIFGGRVRHNTKFVFSEDAQRVAPASRELAIFDYEAYLAFFKQINPNVTEFDWVFDHFAELCENGYCFGLFVDGELASVSQSGPMPYLKDETQEIGIVTAEKYRGRGYAFDVCCANIAKMLRNGKCPMWSCAANNAASHNLATKLGFKPYADVITLA